MLNDIDLATETAASALSRLSRAPESGTRLIVPLQEEPPSERETLDEIRRLDAGTIGASDAIDTVDLSVEVDDASESNFFAPLSGEVDEGGLFVCTWEVLEVGAELVLEIVLPEGAARARGIVLFQRDPSEASSPGYGIALELLDPEAAGLVRAFCERREPLFYDV
jgi:hypothetical protein